MVLTHDPTGTENIRIGSKIIENIKNCLLQYKKAKGIKHLDEIWAYCLDLESIFKFLDEYSKDCLKKIDLKELFEEIKSTVQSHIPKELLDQSEDEWIDVVPEDLIQDIEYDFVKFLKGK